MKLKTCLNCKKELTKRQQKFCSRHCLGIVRERILAKTGARRGKNNYRWNGGVMNNAGSILIKSPKHPFKNKYDYVRRSHLVMEKHIGRYLKKDEIVHHINGIKNDDRIENLVLLKNHSEHMKLHGENNLNVTSKRLLNYFKGLNHLTVKELMLRLAMTEQGVHHQLNKFLTQGLVYREKRKGENKRPHYIYFLKKEEICV